MYDMYTWWHYDVLGGTHDWLHYDKDICIPIIVIVFSVCRVLLTGKCSTQHDTDILSVLYSTSQKGEWMRYNRRDKLTQTYIGWL